MTVSCADFEDAVSDLAIDGVAEPLRSDLLAHADGCASCARALADVVSVSDSLLHLAPRVEPPVGFESRVMARMSERGRARPRLSLPARAAVVAAVLGAAVLGLVVGRIDSGAGRESASGPIVTVTGARMGTADLEPDAGRIVLTMEGESRWAGRWTCQLLDDDGRWVDVASWTAAEVHLGVWAAGVPAGLSDAAMMRILNDDGTVIATATLG